ncbi:MAG: hypothetical protein AMJ69_10300 [Gammaproteobacteria bacterium SG8_47]|nr:MAG: hypothetical protein AMJ69_10300 [Gammaproteobacteria bacterium SG8_47]
MTPQQQNGLGSNSIEWVAPAQGAQQPTIQKTDLNQQIRLVHSEIASQRAQASARTWAALRRT